MKEREDEIKIETEILRSIIGKPTEVGIYRNRKTDRHTERKIER